MKSISYVEALRLALEEEMQRDPKVFVMGEDIGKFGGCFTVTKGLYEKFGKDRVLDTPLCETTIVGAAIGAAFMGMRPVCEIMFCDEIVIAMDQIVNSAAKARYLYGGKNCAPLVIRTAHGGTGRGIGPHHSQALEALFTHIPGLVVVMPSCPADAKGLLKSAIRSDDPVIFLEPKRLYFQKGQVPDGEYLIPFQKADIKRAGNDVTVVATGFMVNKVLQIADKLADKQISLEVIDPRTLMPLDKAAIIKSVEKTKRLVIVEEACKTGSFSAEVAAIAAEEAFEHLIAPVIRITGPDAPIPASKKLESKFFPDENRISKALYSLLNYE